MTDDQLILQDMGRLLGGLVDPALDMQSICIRCQVFPDVGSGMAFWTDSSGVEHSFGELPDGMPTRVLRAMLEKAEELQQTPVFRAAPFTHLELSLGRDRALRLQVVDIPLEQTDLGQVFMRPVSPA